MTRRRPPDARRPARLEAAAFTTAALITFIYGEPRDLAIVLATLIALAAAYIIRITHRGDPPK